MALPPLTLESVLDEAHDFAQAQSLSSEPSLFGVTDGKAVGTFLEHKFRNRLKSHYAFALGNSASGIDFPELDLDIKVTSVAQPQSSCPYKSARQKIWGLGYSLLVFVYAKSDDPASAAAKLDIQHVVFIDQSVTGDFQTTSRLRELLENDANEDDLVAFMHERLLPVDEIGAAEMAQELLRDGPPLQGYLTISNALQWRLQYRRAIALAGRFDGLQRVR